MSESRCVTAIRIALDRRGGRIATDLGGNVYVAGLDGSQLREVLVVQGNLTGIAYVEVPDEQPAR